MIEVEALIADALGIEQSLVDDRLAFQSIQEWDSLGHASLMVALEKALQAPVPDSEVSRLTDVQAIRRYLGQVCGGSATHTASGRTAQPAEAGPTISRGLVGVYVDSSAVTHIDADRGRVEYRGYDVNELAEAATFEQTAFLLAEARLPSPAELLGFNEEIRAHRRLAAPVQILLAALPTLTPIAAIRSAISASEADGGWDPAAADRPATSARLIGLVSAALATHSCARLGREPVRNSACTTAEYALRALIGCQPALEQVRVFDRLLTVHADHDVNASTFAARIAIGAGSTITAAVTGAFATFAGTAHGGATAAAGALIDEVAVPERAVAVVNARLAAHQPVPGFGHRVYRSTDPRIEPLELLVGELIDAGADPGDLAVVEALVAAMARYSSYGMAANVDLYTALLYRMMGLPQDTYPALFALGRVAGWVAHAIEQQQNNVLIRPLQHYVGPRGRRLPGLVSDPVDL